MNFALSEEQQAIREAIERICARFPDEYWLKKDKEGGFPAELHQALARDGWLGIAMPEEYGGSGLGITEAAVMMQAIAESGAGFSGASAGHMNIFGLNPVVVFGTPEQKQRMLPGLIAGRERACFAVTEPNTGLNTTRIKTRAAYEKGQTAPPDWRIACCFVGKGHRRRGVATAALGGAVDLIAGLGGGTVEGYPEDAGSVPAGFLFNGALSTYEQLGFVRDRKIGKHRWVVRRVVEPRS